MPFKRRAMSNPSIRHRWIREFEDGTVYCCPISKLAADSGNTDLLRQWVYLRGQPRKWEEELDAEKAFVSRVAPTLHVDLRGRLFT